MSLTSTSITIKLNFVILYNMRCIILFCITLVIFSKIRNCKGRSGLRVIGGRDADENKYPYIVRLEHQYFISGSGFTVVHLSQSCTAAVLTPRWALTAAHCLDLKTTKSFRNIVIKHVVRYGPLKNNTAIDVIDAIPHPSYRLRYYDIQNDIGLVKLKTLILKEYARVSAVDFVTLVGQEVIMTGYGITNTTGRFTGDATSLGKPLQILEAVVTQCDKQNIEMIPAMCLARRCSKSSGICPGDSGGPLLHPSGVVGVNSLGSQHLEKFCSMSLLKPLYEIGIITPTSPFLDWISGVIKEDEPNI